MDAHRGFMHAVCTSAEGSAWLPLFNAFLLRMKPRQEAPFPKSQDITYLDDFLRITRGGDGSLFVLVKEDSTGRTLI